MSFPPAHIKFLWPTGWETSVCVVRTSASRLAEGERTESGRRKSDMRKGRETPFRPATGRDLLADLRRRHPQAMAGINPMKLAQALADMGVQRVHPHAGNRWRVAEV